MRCKRVQNEKGVVANMKGMNGLKATNQVTLCRYYKGAILSITDSVDGMINDIQAIFHHSISTDENPQHSYCPKGEHTWCKFNKYMDEKAKYPNTYMPVRKHREDPIIPIFYAEHFRECFDKSM